MAIDKKRMQQRYGTFEQYTADKNNLLPNEFASVTSGDTSSTDGTALYFKSGTKDPIKVITENDNTFITIPNKEDNINKAIDKSINDNTNTLKYPSLKYLYSYFYDYNEIDELLEDKANTTDITTINSNISQLSTDITNINTNLANKADKSTTLAGYGITDAYTKEKTDQKLARKLDSMPFDSEPKNNSPCYLTSGTVYSALLVKADKTALATKYDSSNIESGTSKLTPYSTIADKIKSASCTYKTIGDVVIVSATVKMNAVTIGANSTYPLIDLPYKCIAVDNVFCVGISNLGKIFKFAVLKNNTWLQFQSQDKTAYTFADGEQINVICLYKIK